MRGVFFVGGGCNGGDRGGELASPARSAPAPPAPSPSLPLPRRRGSGPLVVVVGVVGELLLLLLLLLLLPPPPAARRWPGRTSSSLLPLLSITRRSACGCSQDAAGDHLRGHVLGRADPRSRGSVDGSREAKVDHFQGVERRRRRSRGRRVDSCSSTNHGILGLEVAVAEAGAVHGRDGRRELLEEARRERLRDAAVGRALDQGQQVGPADELPLTFLEVFFVREKEARGVDEREEKEKGKWGRRRGKVAATLFLKKTEQKSLTTMTRSAPSAKTSSSLARLGCLSADADSICCGVFSWRVDEKEVGVSFFSFFNPSPRVPAAAERALPREKNQGGIFCSQSNSLVEVQTPFLHAREQLQTREARSRARLEGEKAHTRAMDCTKEKKRSHGKFDPVSSQPMPTTSNTKNKKLKQNVSPTDVPRAARTQTASAASQCCRRARPVSRVD